MRCVSMSQQLNGETWDSKLVDHLLLHAPHAFKREPRIWTRAQIAETVRAIVVDVTGQTKFTEDSHFIDDMHLG